MNTNLMQTIDAANLDNDLDTLACLLCDNEDDDDAREMIYAAIDRVSANLSSPIEMDAIWTIA